MKGTKASSNLEDLNQILVKQKQIHQQFQHFQQQQQFQHQQSQQNTLFQPMSPVEYEELRRERSSTLDSFNIQPIDNTRFHSNSNTQDTEDDSDLDARHHHLHKHHRRQSHGSINTELPILNVEIDSKTTNAAAGAGGSRPNMKRTRSATTSAIMDMKSAIIAPTNRSPQFIRRSTSNSLEDGENSTSNNANSISNGSINKSNSSLNNENLTVSFGNGNLESPTWLLSDFLSNLGTYKDKDEYFLVAKGNDLVVLLQQYPDLKKDIVLKTFINKISFMLYHRISEVRSSAYRILRYVVSSYESLMILVQSKVLIFIIVTMSTTRSSLGEKEQALKLIREFLNIDKGTDNLSIGVIKSLISLIESSNEHFYSENDLENPTRSDLIDQHDHEAEVIPEGFKNICVETICEIALLNPELVFHSGGFKIMLNIIIDGNIEMSMNCLMVLYNVLDGSNSRKFLRNGYDLNSLIAVFSNITDEVGDNPAANKRRVNNYRLQKVSFLLTSLLKNFNGLMAVSVNNFKTLVDLISNLKKKNTRVRDYIMDILLDILRIKSLPWLASSPIGEAIKKYNQYSHNESYSFQYPQIDPTENEFAYNIVNHYRGLLSLVLIKNDIFTYLIDVIEQNLNEPNTKKATLLVTNLYSMANNLLPPELVEKNLLLPNLSAVASFEVVKVTRQKFKPTPGYNANLKSSIKHINIESRYDVDDTELRNMITTTKILTIKEFEEWNWPILLNLIQGPLSNPKRFDEILEKNPKFFKRLMSFYRPFKFRFCNIPMTSKNAQKYISIGCQLFELLLSLDSGIRYLSTSKILPQLSEIFAQVDLYSGLSTKDPILARRRLDNTVSVGYVRFIGVFSSCTAGLKMLEQWQFFNLFLNIIEGSSHSDSNNSLILTLFKYVDFSLDSQFRILLQQSLKNSNYKIRIYLLRHLLPQLILIKECELFVVNILSNNIYDGSIEIAHKSIDMLSDHYSSNNFTNLNYFINLRPSIQILSRTASGRNLLINFLNMPSGFRFLEDSGFLDQEFTKWTNIQNHTYLRTIERLISVSFFPIVSLTEVEQDDLYAFNFFKNLLSTEEGLNYFSNMKQKLYLERLIHDVEEVADRLLNDEDFFDLDCQNESQVTLIREFKQNLWIIGNIASGHYGIQLLDPMYNINLEKSIIGTILQLFEQCPIWNIRGLCFYVLGMVSSTIEGIEILDESNWVSVIDPYTKSKCLTYPKQDVSQIFNIEMSNPYRDVRYYSLFGSSAGGSGAMSSMIWDEDEEKDSDQENKGKGGPSSPSSAIPSAHPVTESEEEGNVIDMNERIRHRVISLIQHMNSVLGKIERKAVKELSKLKRFNPEIFESIPLFLEVVKTIDKGNFKYHKRKFIFDLFLDTRVFETLLKKDRKNSIRA
ncbi:Rapamycin-insensitive companion of mTOR, middle domain-containing protein [Scheffersomyces xylosifermentans]|uniref:Rapamycin-insensitive companion of mTOR, middle domain-containing protein n=1 Tax=Scheffersomyces xylosifermentans TaxID=1304137 RepID=UPI00315C7BBB